MMYGLLLRTSDMTLPDDIEWYVALYIHLLSSIVTELTNIAHSLHGNKVIYYN